MGTDPSADSGATTEGAARCRPTFPSGIKALNPPVSLAATGLMSVRQGPPWPPLLLDNSKAKPVRTWPAFRLVAAEGRVLTTRSLMRRTLPQPGMAPLQSQARF